MALIPKAVPVTTTPTQAASRVGPGHRVASVAYSQVEGLNAGTGVSFDAAPSGFHDERPNFEEREGGGNRRRPEGDFTRLFRADSQVFATILESQSEPAPQSRSEGRRRAAVPPARAIHTYENNFQVITGTMPVRGTSLSISL